MNGIQILLLMYTTGPLTCYTIKYLCTNFLGAEHEDVTSLIAYCRRTVNQLVPSTFCSELHLYMVRHSFSVI